ncbi:unnamed protein product [Paramecium sonneborni]|uniref:APCDD1 domain-containing protein n=1 Tax=Paramecium sonneborni TaxID=65129 RepID=A0A8S1RH47_9CILI|nr:unnamed protein product [Paramecium sonneborni]
MKNNSFTILSFITLIIMMNGVQTQTLDELKEKIVNEWKSLSLELIPNQIQDTVVAEYQRREWNFTQEFEFSTKIENFNDYSGKNRTTSIEGVGVITFQSESDVIKGAYLCQFTFNKSAIITLHTDELVNAFNQLENGDKPWVKDQPRNVTTLAVPVFNKLANQFFIAYDLIYIKDNYLYMGEVDAFGNEATQTQPPKGLCAPLIPLNDDVESLSLEELKEEMINGVWSSMTKEIRPGRDANNQLTTIYITRELWFPTDSTFGLKINFFPDQGNTNSQMELEMLGSLIWEGDASSVVPGAQFAQFVVDQLYLTPKNDQFTANFNSNLPQGVEPFQTNLKANMTAKDFPAFGLTKNDVIKENDLVYLRQNRFYLGARPVDAGRPYPIERRTYSLADDLIDPEREIFSTLLIVSYMLILINI